MTPAAVCSRTAPTPTTSSLSASTQTTWVRRVGRKKPAARFAASIANYKTGAGILAAFLVLTTYLYTSSLIFMIGVELDELLRRRAA